MTAPVYASDHLQMILARTFVPARGTRAAWLAAFSLAGCQSMVTPPGLTFPNAYEMTFDYGRDLTGEVLMFVYDQPAMMSAVMRRDSRNIEIGSFEEIFSCSWGDRCLVVGELEGPLVILAPPLDQVVADGWRIEVARNTMDRSSCDSYTASRTNDALRYQYVHCGGVGVIRMTTFDGPTKLREYELRSYIGVAAFPG
ncbi:hypothetical protein ACETK8_06085 [Brevundimonas staleyi]|uniref:Lipoprotein n=1 Tax=Brevundimonas staleyi TaxID=74326 RepID=A0ABW0FLP8_9CAUL